ncbi:OmpA/MotB family protein [Lutibaculum baratangense]|uniref:Flagellar motor rotation protein MotB n=1 Tax=Lutibaculum baratangense AMV1 TaxID=631454 RepID=V4TP48_9HYPH|nr:flagellar motor protein MotB [Lutibaculum baratangense]ESR27458.1 Flagellar motor rotation protein MotB [Lutibaculum baratangense AMV1]
MRRRNWDGATGAPKWIVTFADLMSLLAAFFILIISFSIQDEEKLQIVAGSMRDAFGVDLESRRSGVIELEGLPERQYLKRQSPVPTEDDTSFAEFRHDENLKQGPEANTHRLEEAEIETPRRFATAAASLRQAWQEMPEILELSDQIIFQETEEGLEMQIVDQEGRSMFPPGSRRPYERTRLLLETMASKLALMPNRLVITGHTGAETETAPGRSDWDLSAERALTVRGILAAHGLPDDRFATVSGAADSEPLFPENPFMAANRRITILLKAEKPPVPPGLEP